MKLISIIIPEQAVISSIMDARHCFETANDMLRAKGAPALFKVELVGFAKEMWLENGTVCLKADRVLADADVSDLVIVPAIAGDIVKATQLNRHYYSWLVKQYKGGAEIASFCLGAFLVAATGLLNGKKCASHWLYANEFRIFYPDITLLDDKIISEQNGIFSSGGGISYWNLLLYMLERYTSRQIVLSIVKHFLLDIDRNSQASFVIFKGQKAHGDTLVLAVQEYIENNYRDKISINDLAEQFAVVRRTLERRFRSATKNSISEYIQRIKVEAAKKEIETGRKTIQEIMYEIGYSDKTAFRNLFAQATGLTPVEYRNKFNSSSKM